MTTGALCTGYGGLELAVDDDPAWVAEVDPFAAAVLDRRFGVPNLGDITRVDWATVEPVDTLTAGFPCQDISHAGLGAGIQEGNRSGLWYEVAAAVRELRPRRVVIENVGALRSRGLDIVTWDLAALGYVGSWVSVRASDVGACHRRERVFIVAVADPDGGGRGADERGVRQGQPDADRSRDAGGGSGSPADADRSGLGRQPHIHADQCTLGGEAQQWHHADRRPRRPLDLYEPAVARWERLTRPAPDARDHRGRLNPWFVEWMQGLPEGWVCDVVRRRTDALRILGNGVVPQQARYGIALAEAGLP